MKKGFIIYVAGVFTWIYMGVCFSSGVDVNLCDSFNQNQYDLGVLVEEGNKLEFNSINRLGGLDQQAID